MNRRLRNPLSRDLVPDIRAWLADFGHVLVPDWTDLPIYVLGANLQGCIGMADPLADVTYQETITDWQGRGVAIVLDLQALRRLARRERRYPPARDRHFRIRAIETAIHEFAHVLERDRPYAEPVQVWPPEKRQAAIRKSLRLRCRTPLDQSFVALAHHQAVFLRMAAHLSYRAGRQGIAVPLSLIGAGPAYGLSPASMYMTTLRTEVETMAAWPFAAIKTTDPPQEFSLLWQADVARWCSRVANVQDVAAAVAVEGAAAAVAAVVAAGAAVPADAVVVPAVAAVVAAARAYLRVCGHLVYAYLWARMAKAALAKEASGDPFYAAKLATARFYFAKLLPETAALIRTARAGAAPMMDFDAALF
jgi:hypothetical protein